MKAKKIFHILLVLILFSSNSLFAQIKTDTKTMVLDSKHSLFSMVLRHNGVAVEIEITNLDPTTTYVYSYTITYKLRCGTNSQTISDKGTIRPNAKQVSLSKLLNDCVADNSKRTANSVVLADVSIFKADKIKK